VPARHPFSAAALAVVPLAVAAALALGASAGPARAAGGSDLRLAVSAALQYDDNVLSGSERARDDLGKRGAEARYGLASAEDWVAIGNLQLRWTSRPLPRRATVVAAGVESHRYSVNTVKNYEEIDLSVAQEVTASRRWLGQVVAAGQWIPDTFVRNLTDDDASVEAGQRVRAGARYEELTLALGYEQELVPGRLSGSIGREWRRRDFTAAFDERDSERTLWAVALSGRPLARGRVQLEAGYSRGTLAARGDLPASPFPDDDVSYDVTIAGLSARLPWGGRHPGALTLAWEQERRALTTTNRFDVLRYGRVDRRNEFDLRLTQRLAARLDLLAEWRIDAGRAELPQAFAALEERVEFDRNRISLGVRYRLPLAPQDAARVARAAP
jgi:hypothetical protein